MRAPVRTIALAAVAALSPAAAAAAAPGQYAFVPTLADGAAVAGVPAAYDVPPVITYRDGRVRALVGELEATSATAARMLGAIRAYGVPVVFGTARSVLPDVRAEHDDYDPYRKKALGFMAPTVRHVPGTSSLTTYAMVIGIDLERVEEIFQVARRIPRPAAYTWAEIERFETLALLAHEIVHAYGLVMAGGDPRRGCLDPHEDEPTRLSCVVLGENLIRREIGAPLDWGYGLPPLSELPARYEAASERRTALRAIARQASRILSESRGLAPALQPEARPGV